MAPPHPYLDLIASNQTHSEVWDIAPPQAPGTGSGSRDGSRAARDNDITRDVGWPLGNQDVTSTAPLNQQPRPSASSSELLMRTTRAYQELLRDHLAQPSALGTSTSNSTLDLDGQHDGGNLSSIYLRRRTLPSAESMMLRDTSNDVRIRSEGRRTDAQNDEDITPPSSATFPNSIPTPRSRFRNRPPQPASPALDPTPADSAGSQPSEVVFHIGGQAIRLPSSLLDMGIRDRLALIRREVDNYRNRRAALIDLNMIGLDPRTPDVTRVVETSNLLASSLARYRVLENEIAERWLTDRQCDQIDSVWNVPQSPDSAGLEGHLSSEPNTREGSRSPVTGRGSGLRMVNRSSRRDLTAESDDSIPRSPTMPALIPLSPVLDRVVPFASDPWISRYARGARDPVLTEQLANVNARLEESRVAIRSAMEQRAEFLAHVHRTHPHAVSAADVASARAEVDRYLVSTGQLPAASSALSLSEAERNASHLDRLRRVYQEPNNRSGSASPNLSNTNARSRTGTAEAGAQTGTQVATLAGGQESVETSVMRDFDGLLRRSRAIHADLARRRAEVGLARRDTNSLSPSEPATSNNNPVPSNSTAPPLSSTLVPPPSVVPSMSRASRSSARTLWTGELPNSPSLRRILADGNEPRRRDSRRANASSSQTQYSQWLSGALSDAPSHGPVWEQTGPVLAGSSGRAARRASEQRRFEALPATGRGRNTTTGAQNRQDTTGEGEVIIEDSWEEVGQLRPWKRKTLEERLLINYEPERKGVGMSMRLGSDDSGADEGRTKVMKRNGELCAR